MTKCCGICGVTKPVSDFHSRPGASDGLRNQCKRCRATQRHESYLTNRTQALVSAQSWSRANPEKRKASHRKYYEANKAAINAAAKIWAKNNPEKYKLGIANWRKRNRCRVNISLERYRDKKYQNVTTLTYSDWLQILDYFNGRCAYCLGRFSVLELEHLIPVSKGGGTTIENIVPACRSCNARKHNRPIWSLLAA